MMELKFYITEYVDGNLEVETKHLHYAFRDDMNYDDFAPNMLQDILSKIAKVCRAEGIKPVFVRA